MSQIINALEEAAPTIVEEEYVEEENQAQADHYFTILFEEGDNVEQEAVDEGDNDEQHIPVGNVFCPPSHMTNLSSSVDQSSFEWPHIHSLPMEGDIDVGNQFKNKVVRVLSIKNIT